VNETELLRRLGDMAGDESDPTLDVTRQVKQRLRQHRMPSVDRKLAFASLCACTCAGIAVVVSLSAPPASDSASALAQLVTSSTAPDVLLRLVEP
jgi:hypothetical protein